MIINQLSLMSFLFIIQNQMDSKDPPNTSISTAPQKKKKYKKIERRADQPQNKTQESNEGSFNLTKTQINPHFNQDISSIHQQNISVLTANNSNLQTTFLGSNMKQFLNQQTELQEEEVCRNCKEKIDDEDWLKVLKKYIKKVFANAKNIEIVYSSTKPSLYFHFHLDENKETKKIPLKDIIKANKQIGKNESQTIADIFDRLYFRVGEEFHKMLQLVLQLADKERVDLRLPDKKELKNPMLYYCINKKSTNFTFFDKDMRIFQFSGLAVKKMKMEPKYEKLCKKFETIVDSRRKQGERVIEQYGQYEASSDQESKHTVTYQQKIDVQAFKKQLRKITSMNLAEYEDEIEEKQQLFNEMQRKDDHKSKAELEKLADDLGELQSNLENFKEAIAAVEKQEQILRPADSQRYKNLLKKMILAKKQLENKLPITAKKREIFNALDKEDIIILEGETGSGKSTQLPQMLCEYFKMFDEKGKSTLPILITQPRKLATRTVAERVASEMEEKIGGFVDYTTSPHKPVSKTAKIIFKMDALVLDEITVDRLLSKYSCLIIDEAHERTISIDVILGLIKELQTKRSKFKVIVTSASLDAKLFSVYFNKKVMKVSGRLYPVEVIHRHFHESDAVRKIEKVIKDDILLNGSEIRKEYKGDVLVFCSGVEQINILCNIFHKYVNPRVFQVYPLHGRIAPNEQKLIFLQTKEHKLIFASRIAQTSITINGVKVVVDPGLDRQEVYDQKNRVSSRKLVNISQSSAKQRAGRAGRTSKGYCFRLYTQAQMQGFRPNKTPEIQNMALDTLVLRLKMLNVQEIFKFAYINKPDDKALEKSVETLQMIGALSFTGEITTVGKLLLQLRIEPFLGRAIVQAIICQQIIKKTNYAERQLRKTAWKESEIKRLHFIRQSIVEILSMVISSSNVFTFLTQFDRDRDNLDEVKFKKFSDQRGDFFYLLNIYDEFIYHCQHSPPHELNNWLRSRFLNKKTLFQVKELINEINETVKNFNFDLKDPSAKKLVDIIKIRMTQCKNADDVILSCMMTSFCVNLCLYSNNPNIGYTMILQKKPVAIYGTSTLALQSKYPKWIICYDLKTNDKGVTYCQIAHQVDYNFMKRTVDDQVFEKLNLKQAEKMNPFYQAIQRQLPTLIVQQINNDYMNRENLVNNVAKYFKHLSILFDQETNTISMSWPKQLKMSDIHQKPNTKVQITIKDQLQKYINEKILEKKVCCMNFHLMSNVFLEMKDGFIIKNVFFTSKEVQFLAEGDSQSLSTVKNLFQGQNINCKKISKEKLKVSTIFQSQYAYVKQMLQGYGLNFCQYANQKKQQSLNTKIYMKFYTGKPQSGQPIFMYYGKDVDVHDMCDILETCRRQQKKKTAQEKYRYLSILWESAFKASKNGTGIRCFNKKADAFQLKQAIQYLTIFGVLPFNFIIPRNYREFRETDNVLAIKRQKQWESDIEKVFAKYGFKNISIKVKGDDRFKRQQTQNRRNMEAMMNYQLSAELSGESIEVLDELVKKLDGKQNLIGAGKIHFRYNFKQFIVKINNRAFKALRDTYEYLKDKYETLSAQLRIQSYEKNFGKVSNVFINCRSPNREKLLEPSEKIKQLFTPYILRLESTQFNFLMNSQQGEDFLTRIEEQYSNHIYLSFERKKNQIKIYCDDEDIDAISQRILDIFQKYTFCVDKVSYRGKGLNKVTSLIDKEVKWLYQHSQKTKSNKFLEYRIIFKWRQIQLEGDAASINKIKGDISSLVNEEPGSCHICLKNTEKPYRLFNCDHSFCWKCLGDFIEQSRKQESNGAELLCPEDNCYKPINPYDMRAILSTEQFQSFSMKRLREHIIKTKQYFFCPTSGCDQLFQEVSIAKNNSFECFMCGKWYCSKCKQPHQHFTCHEWATKLANGQLSKFGYKKCKCGAVLQKEVRGKIIQCKQCRQYLCWACIKGWKLERDCQNHIRACKIN